MSAFGRIKKKNLKADVEVEEANGSLFSKFILFLHPPHLNNTQTLWLSWKGLHTQWLQAVLKTINRGLSLNKVYRKIKKIGVFFFFIFLFSKMKKSSGLWKYLTYDVDDQG